MNKLLPRNEHAIDRTLRILLGITILSLTVIGPQTAWGFLGLIPLATGIAGSCPVYTLFGVTTCRMKTKAA